MKSPGAEREGPQRLEIDPVDQFQRGRAGRPRICEAALAVRERTAENSQIFAKMSKLIFRKIWLFSYARELSLRRSSFRRKLFVSLFKPIRQNGCPEGPSGPFGEVFEGE